MCRTRISLVCFVLVLCLGLNQTNATKAEDPNLVGWWMLDETSGTIATDSSGNGNRGTIY